MIGSSALLILLWPILLTTAAFTIWHNQLRRRWFFLVLGISGCVLVELILSNGLLFVVAGPDILGLVARLLAGGALLYGLYRYDQRHSF